MSQRPDSITDNDGFTLVEVMVAITILSLVLVATVTGFRTLAQTQQSIERLTARVDDIRSVSSFLRDAIESSVVGKSRGRLSTGGVGRETTYFRGSSDALEWKSTLMFGENFGGVYLLRLAREGEQLVLRWHEPRSTAEGIDWAESEFRVLADELNEFKLFYREENDGPWEETMGQSSIPVLVRMQLRVEGRYWPELIMRVPSSQ